MSKSTRQKARSSPTQTWIPLGKLETIYNFAASLCCTTQSLLRTILDQGSWSLSQSCNSCAATFALEIWDGMRQNRLLRWLPRHAKQSLLGGWRRTWNQCHFPWNVKLIKQLHKHNTKLDFLCELVALGKTKQLQSRSTTSHDWNKVALTFNNQNYIRLHSNPHIGNAIAWLHAPTTLPFDVWRLRAEAFALLSIEHASSIDKLQASGSQDLTYCPWVSRCTDQSL